MTDHEQVRFLAASEHRVEALRSIVDDPRSPSALCEDLGVSRATVHRALDSFEEFGWIRRGEDGYRATAAGRIVLGRFDDLRDAVAEVDSMSDFLVAFDRAHDLPIPLEDYRIETATRADPYAATEFFVGAVPTDAARLRALLPTVVPAFNRACEPLVEREASIHLVLARSAAETSQESYPEDFEQARSLDCLTLSVAREPFEFGLSVFDCDVFLGAYDGNGHLQSCLHSTDEDLREWALSVFDRYREEARTANPAAES